MGFRFRVCCCCCCWLGWCCVELNGFYVLILYNTASLRQKSRGYTDGLHSGTTPSCVCVVLLYLCVCVSILHGPGFVDSIYLKKTKKVTRMSGSAPHDWGLPSKSNLILVRKELNLQSLSRERESKVIRSVCSSCQLPT